MKPAVKTAVSPASTPKEDRVKLLKEWAVKRGYSTQVTKTETGFRVELSKNIAQK